MARGSDLLHNGPPIVKTKTFLSREKGRLPAPADRIVARDGGFFLFCHKDNSSQGSVYNLSWRDLGDAGLRERYLADFIDPQYSFLSEDVIAWQGSENGQVNMAHPPSFLQAHSFPPLPEEEGQIEDIYLSEKKLFAVVKKDGILRLMESSLDGEWRPREDDQGQEIDNILAFSVNEREDSLLLLHREMRGYRLSFFKQDGSSRSWDIQGREIFDSDFWSSLARFSYAEKEEGQFYYLDHHIGKINILDLERGTITEGLNLSGQAHAFLVDRGHSVVLYEGGDLEVIRRDGKREIVRTEKDYGSIALLKPGKVMLYSSGDELYETVSF